MKVWCRTETGEPPWDRLDVARDASWAAARHRLAALTAADPAVFAGGVAQFSLSLDARSLTLGDVPFLATDMPADIGRAVPKRQVEFMAGRYCASRALACLGADGRGTLPRGADGVPIWPSGFTGSISHTDGFVTAAAASLRQVAALAVDSQRLMTETRAAKLSRAIGSPVESRLLLASGLPPSTALTLLFSAKESLFKLIHPQVRRMFGLLDAELVELAPTEGAFRLRLSTSLSDAFPAATAVPGRYEVDELFVHTGMLMPAGPGPSL